MSATIRIFESDYGSAARLHHKFTWRRFAVYVSFVGLIALCYLLRTKFGTLDLVMYVFIGGLIGLFLSDSIGRAFVIPYQIKKQYRAYKAIKLPTKAELMDEGIYFENEDAAGLLRWDAIVKWRENDAFILLYQNASLYNIIPKAAESSDFSLDELIGKLSQHVGDAV